MTINKCDICTSRVETLTNKSLDGFKPVDICDECLDIIGRADEKIAVKQQASRVRALCKLGLEPEANDGPQLHDHVWSEGWVENLTGKRIIHKVCGSIGCPEKLIG